MITFSRRRLLAGAATAPVAASAGWKPPRQQNRQPNIILILVDQLTPFMTSPYGHNVAHTPNLDRLARSGSVLENAYCNSPLCVPSRTSMFSGRFPAQVGTTRRSFPLTSRRLFTTCGAPGTSLLWPARRTLSGRISSTALKSG